MRRTPWSAPAAARRAGRPPGDPVQPGQGRRHVARAGRRWPRRRPVGPRPGPGGRSRRGRCRRARPAGARTRPPRRAGPAPGRCRPATTGRAVTSGGAAGAGDVTAGGRDAAGVEDLAVRQRGLHQGRRPAHPPGVAGPGERGRGVVGPVVRAQRPGPGQGGASPLPRLPHLGGLDPGLDLAHARDDPVVRRARRGRGRTGEPHVAQVARGQSAGQRGGGVRGVGGGAARARGRTRRARGNRGPGPRRGRARRRAGMRTLLPAATDTPGPAPGAAARCRRLSAGPASAPRSMPARRAAARARAPVRSGARTVSGSIRASRAAYSRCCAASRSAPARAGRSVVAVTVHGAAGQERAHRRRVAGGVPEPVGVVALA